MVAGSGNTERRIAPARPDVIDEIVAGEAVIVHLGTGRYFALNPAATSLWMWIGAGRSAAELQDLDGLPDGWIGTATDLLDAWIDEGLVVDAVASQEVDPVASDGLDGVEGPPEMRTFTDLEDLLLLDPIHDVQVGDDGLPVTRTSG